MNTKHYKLHKRKQLIAFMDDCYKYCTNGTKIQLNAIKNSRPKCEWSTKDAHSLYCLVKNDPRIWDMKYYCLLNSTSRNTFGHYGLMTVAQRTKALS